MTSNDSSIIDWVSSDYAKYYSEGNISTLDGDNSHNQSIYYLQLRNDTNLTLGSAGSNNISGSENVLSLDAQNDSAKIAYESGSNFMLLLEDFSEYFYNYNGTGFNETSIANTPTNCSLANSTCPHVYEGK